jgi:hypothetical protein
MQFAALHMSPLGTKRAIAASHKLWLLSREQGTLAGQAKVWGTGASVDKNITVPIVKGLVDVTLFPVRGGGGARIQVLDRH